MRPGQAVVTGAAGFLGSHVARSLCGAGTRVRGGVQSPEDAKGWETDDVEPVVADLRDPRALRRAVHGADVVFHCAARIPGGGDDPSELWEINVDGTKNLLDACLAEGVRRMVYVSSDSIYGDGHLPSATEQTAPCPEYFGEGSYPRSKLEGERLATAYHQAGQISTSVIRPCLMYGPGYSPGTQFIRRFAARRLHRFIGGGTARWSLGYVEDVARAVILAGTVPAASGEIYNVSDGSPHSIRELAEVLSEVTGRRPHSISVPPRLWTLACRSVHPVANKLSPALARRFDPELSEFLCRDHVMSIEKATRELGYEPSVTLREGCRRTFEWLAAPHRNTASSQVVDRQIPSSKTPSASRTERIS